MFRRWWLVVLVLALAVTAGAQEFNFTILQLNDIYEITPVQGGKAGGMARVAALREQLAKADPHTITILAGDCFSPSALGTAVVDGKPLAGKQMVDIMNAVGFNYVTFGNHEFDIPEAQFLERLKESKFTWVSSNVRDRDGNPFPGVLDTARFVIRAKVGPPLRVAIFGLTVDANQKPWAKYLDPIATARAKVQELKPNADVIIAITHLPIEQDMQLAEQVPGIDLILGGHEHENIQVRRGDAFTPVFKADANARTVYIHHVTADIASHEVKVRSELRTITDADPEDPAVAQRVKEWVDRGFAAFRAGGFDPDQVVARSPMALDGRESSVRNHPTELTDMIAAAMMREAGEAAAAVFNSGSVRVDDVLPPGALTQYDVIRILPFGGKIMVANVRGDVLRHLLDVGRASKGKGGYLQTAGITFDPSAQAWTIAGAPLDPAKTYRIATTDFLINGGEAGMGFFTQTAEGVSKVTPKRDIRFAVIEELKAKWPEDKKRR